MSGVYCITCLISGNQYVGSSVNIPQRWRRHRFTLNNGKHKNPHLQSAWKKYGSDAFRFDVLETCEPCECVAREQIYLDLLRSQGTKLYNASPTSTMPRLGCKNKPCTTEQRRKISEANRKRRGEKRSEETKARISASLTGRQLSDEARTKIGAAFKGKKLAKEHKERIRAVMKGKQLSEETKMISIYREQLMIHLATKPLPVDDLRRVVEAVDWSPLYNKHVLITGVGGFVGLWMWSSVWQWGIDDGGRWPVHIERCDSKQDATKFWPMKRPDFIVHATTDGVGWQHVAALARAADAKMLLLSSGAVYGKEDWFCMPTSSTHTVRRNLLKTKYGANKGMQEQCCKDVAVIARLFSFIGPGLRRHTGREFLEADPIVVKDDGAVRSYMHASDMAIACWSALLHGEVGRAYNIGSSIPIRVLDFARKCAEKRDVGLSVSNGSGGTYYVPDTSRIEKELGFVQRVQLGDAIERTLEWARS